MSWNSLAWFLSQWIHLWDVLNLEDNAIINCFKSQKSKSEEYREKPSGDPREVSEKEGQAAQVGRDIPED